MNRILYLNSDDYSMSELWNPSLDDIKEAGLLNKLDIFSVEEFCEAFNDDKISDLGYILPIDEETAFKLFSE